MSPLETPISYNPYIGLGQFKSWLNQENVTGRDGDLAFVLESSCEWVQTYLQGPVTPTAVTEIKDGSSAGGPDGSMLMLIYAPLIQVTEVIEGRGSPADEVTLAETTPSSTAQDGYQVDYLYGRVIRSFGAQWTRPWFVGSRNIQISYIAGYQSIPSTIIMATLQHAAYTWTRLQDARFSGNAQGLTDPGTLLFPGVAARITEALDPYRHPVIA